jgi:hypothetical protein
MAALYVQRVLCTRHAGRRNRDTGVRALDAQVAHICWQVTREQGVITEAGDATPLARLLERTSSSAERTLIYRRGVGKRASALSRSSGYCQW